MADRVSSLDVGYQVGDLSIYPAAKDDRKQLYEVRNNAEAVLVHGVTYGGRYLVVDDTSKFPDAGMLRVGDEIIYYESKTSTVFKDLKRGFAGSRQSPWSAGIKVVNAVMAESHNATKDAIINIEKNLGLDVTPDATSLNGILKSLETKFLAPKPVFRAVPSSGAAPLTVKFQNFAGGEPFNFRWDFGDGSFSTDVAPTHTYTVEKEYDVKLNMITTLGAQGVATKTKYIVVDNTLAEGFYYFTPSVGNTSTVFTFVDQTNGDVANRYWTFGDGNSETQNDPDIHTATHVYSDSGSYETSLMVVFTDQTLRKYTTDVLVVI